MPRTARRRARPAFVLAAIVYDATINNGSWTQRETKPKPVH